MRGDRWTFEVRDEIAGTVGTQTSVVTEVTQTNVTMKYDIVRPDGTHDEGLALFDRSRNLLRNGSTEYVPYFGLNEIQLPLNIGKTWTFEFKSITGRFTRNWAGRSMVVGQEAVTTKAGTFETYKIETTASGVTHKDGMPTDEVAAQTWYAPSTANWVKRSVIRRRDNRPVFGDTYELVEFERGR